MKKIFIATTPLFLICIMLLTGCAKSVDSNLSAPASVYSPGDIAADPAFTGLYDALNHFDPRYLQVVYNDQRSIEEINIGAATLIKKMEQDTMNLKLQQELADIYRFKNIEELKYFSNQVAVNAAFIKNKYYAHVTNFSSNDVATYFKARSIYARNRMDSVRNIEKIKPSSMYDDYVLNPEPPAFGFFGEMDFEGLDGGGLGGCKDACCTDLVSCKERSGRNFLSNIAFIGSQLGTSIGIVGAGVASLVPIVGTITGGAIGVSLGGYIGAFIANTMYNSDIYACTLDYQACIQRKNGK